MVIASQFLLVDPEVTDVLNADAGAHDIEHEQVAWDGERVNLPDILEVFGNVDHKVVGILVDDAVRMKLLVVFTVLLGVREHEPLLKQFSLHPRSRRLGDRNMEILDDLFHLVVELLDSHVDAHVVVGGRERLRPAKLFEEVNARALDCLLLEVLWTDPEPVFLHFFV